LCQKNLFDIPQNHFLKIALTATLEYSCDPLADADAHRREAEIGVAGEHRVDQRR